MFHEQLAPHVQSSSAAVSAPTLNAESRPAPDEPAIPAPLAHEPVELAEAKDSASTEQHSPVAAPPEATVSLAAFAPFMALWEAQLADVTFPGSNGDALSRASFCAWHSQLQDANVAVITAERALVDFAAQRSHLNTLLRAQATRALAYARVFALDNTELTARIDEAERAIGLASTADRTPRPNTKVRRKRSIGQSVIELGQAQLHGLSGDNAAAYTRVNDAERPAHPLGDLDREPITPAASPDPVPDDANLSNAERQIQRFGSPKTRKRQRNLKIEPVEPTAVDDF
jgi:hypothetical protein